MPKAGARKAAQAAGLSRYHSGRPCKYNHGADRWTANGSCVVCTQERARSPRYRTMQAVWRADNAEHIRAYHSIYTTKHRERKAAYDKVYRIRKQQKTRQGPGRGWEQR
jgi:hypothetical protein